MRSLRFLLVSLATWFLPLVARAADTTEGFLDDIAGAADYAPTSSDPLPVIVGNIINIFLSILGVIFIVLLIYGGYTWMTARGDEDKVKDATATIRNAVIGLIIVLLAYSISAFVVDSLVRASFGT